MKNRIYQNILILLIRYRFSFALLIENIRGNDILEKESD